MNEETTLNKNEDQSNAKPFYKSYKFLVFVLVLLLYPYKTLEVPEWKVTFLDEMGKPVSGVRAYQHWKNYTFGTEFTEVRTTNAEGIVIFPEITFRMPFCSALFFQP